MTEMVRFSAAFEAATHKTLFWDGLISVFQAMQLYSGRKEETFMASNVANGIVSKRSKFSVDETQEKLTRTLQAKGIAIFAIIDHSGEAKKAGLKMPPTKLVIFGSPKAGTPLMLAAPSIAIDLPLKILISEDDQGRAWVSYNSAEYLQRRHGIPSQLLQNIAVIETLAKAVTE